jgi:hypothetical protein
MKKTLLLATLGLSFCAGKTCVGSDWVPMAPVVQKVEYVPYYYYVPAVTMVPLVTQYAPVVKYENVMVESQSWCLLKKYQVVAVPKVVYVPMTQTIKY